MYSRFISASPLSEANRTTKTKEEKTDSVQSVLYKKRVHEYSEGEPEAVHLSLFIQLYLKVQKLNFKLMNAESAEL